MKRTLMMLVSLGVAAAVAHAAPIVVIDDNFDGYANQAAFEAVWVPSGTSGTLTSAVSYSAPNSIRNPIGTTRNDRTFSAAVGTDIKATDAEPLVWSYQFYDDPENIGTLFGGVNKLGRSYNQLLGRDAGGALAQLIAIGHWNANVHKASNPGGPVAAESESRQYYHTRIAFVDGGNWRLEDLGPLRTAGWHEMKAVIGSTQIQLYIDDQLVRTGTYASEEGAVGWYQARIGSGLSTGTDTNTDNYYLAVVPDPATLALMGLGGLMFARRRRAL